MYTLYYHPGACSLATQVVIHELGQGVNIVDKQNVNNFSSINPVGTVPVLVDNDITYREGAAVMLYLLDKHPNNLLPAIGKARDEGIQNIMFANATMHPAYSLLFFIAHNISDETAKQSAFEAAAQKISGLWQVVEQQLQNQDYLGGNQPSAADIMLTVYSRWGASFPIDIPLGLKTQKMLDMIMAMPSFKRALETEESQAAA